MSNREWRRATQEHRKYLDGLQRAAIADADHVRALSALTPEDREYLIEMGWQEPLHARFVRINDLDVERLPVPIK